MLKKIKPSDVRLGMYIEKIRGNWLEHPFWRKSFKISEQKDLDKLINCGLDEIWIDTRKGLDVEVCEENNLETPKSSNALIADSDKQITEITEITGVPQPAKKTLSQIPVEEELSTAKKNTWQGKKNCYNRV